MITFKKALLLFLLFGAILTCTSCQKTPEKAVVVDKSEGLPADKIIPVDNNTSKNLEIPADWHETMELNKGYVTIEADCDLNIPEIYNTPVYSYEIKPMTNEFLNELCKYFAKENKLYKNPKMTKAELEFEKKKMENYEDGWGYHGGTIYYDAGYEDKIKRLEELIDEAPNNKEEHQYISPALMAPVPTEKEIVKNSTSGWHYWYYDTDEKIAFTARVETDEKCDPIIRATGANSKVGSTTKFLYCHGIFKDELELERDFDNCRMMKRKNNDYENYLNFLKLELEKSQDNNFSEEDALKIVELVESDLCIENFSIVNCVKAIGTTDGESWAGLENGVSPQCVGYSFYLSPKAGDLTAFTLPRTLQSSELPETVYAPSFLPEQINIIVTKEGIQKFEWTYISKKKAVIAENTELMSFKEIKEKIKDHLLYFAVSMGFESARELGYSNNFIIKNVQLRATNINAFEDPGSTWLVPVWVFEVLFQQIDPDGKIYFQSTTYFLINAIDGGYITVPMV